MPHSGLCTSCTSAPGGMLRCGFCSWNQRRDQDATKFGRGIASYYDPESGDDDEDHGGILVPSCDECWKGGATISMLDGRAEYEARERRKGRGLKVSWAVPIA